MAQAQGIAAAARLFSVAAAVAPCHAGAMARDSRPACA